MAEVNIYLWDVERGDAILIKGPKKNAIIDLGSHRQGFSPSEHIRYNHGVESVDYLVVTHPDNDHIDDLPKFLDLYQPSVVAKRDDALPYVKRRKNQLYPDDEDYQNVVDAYIRLSNKFTNDARFTPRDEKWNQGLTIHHDFLSIEEAGVKPINRLRSGEKVNLNNLSIISILQYGNFQLVTMGDLESSAIESLLQKSSVRTKMKNTDVLIAPHHGRDSSYTSELFRYMEPSIIAISDAAAGSTNASAKYSNQASGKIVQRRNGSEEIRNVVTTRNDGVVYLGTDGDGYKVKID